MSPEAGVVAAILAFAGTMLTAMVAAYKMLADFYKTALMTCNEDKKTCYSENKTTVEKAYALVDAFKDLKTVTAESVQKVTISNDKITKIERAIEELQRDLARRGGS